MSTERSDLYSETSVISSIGSSPLQPRLLNFGFYLVNRTWLRMIYLFFIIFLTRGALIFFFDGDSLGDDSSEEDFDSDSDSDSDPDSDTDSDFLSSTICSADYYDFTNFSWFSRQAY